MTKAYQRLVRRAEVDPLSQALSATLRAALEAGDEEFARWARLELMGYVSENPAMGEDVVVPGYRTIGGQWCDEFGRLFVVTDPKLDVVNETRLRQGVHELETLASAQGIVSMRLPGFSEIISEKLHVEVSIFRFPAHSAKQVLATIRGQLLDRLASRRDQLDRRARAPTPVSSSKGGIAAAGTLPGDIIQLKPSLYGIGIDLRALWRKWRAPRDHPK